MYSGRLAELGGKRRQQGSEHAQPAVRTDSAESTQADAEFPPDGHEISMPAGLRRRRPQVPHTSPRMDHLRWMSRWAWPVRHPRPSLANASSCGAVSVSMPSTELPFPETRRASRRAGRSLREPSLRVEAGDLRPARRQPATVTRSPIARSANAVCAVATGSSTQPRLWGKP